MPVRTSSVPDAALVAARRSLGKKSSGEDIAQPCTGSARRRPRSRWWRAMNHRRSGVGVGRWLSAFLEGGRGRVGHQIALRPPGAIGGFIFAGYRVPCLAMEVHVAERNSLLPVAARQRAALPLQSCVINCIPVSPTADGSDLQERHLHRVLKSWQFISVFAYGPPPAHFRGSARCDVDPAGEVDRCCHRHPSVTPCPFKDHRAERDLAGIADHTASPGVPCDFARHRVRDDARTLPGST